MSRRSLITLVAVALAGLALASAAIAGARRPLTGAPTVATVYRPFSSSGSVLMSITATKSGNCFVSSGTTGRSDAWRCIFGNFILDPCFSSTAATAFVLCPTAPWTNRGIKITLKSKLPLAHANHGPISLAEQPWALQLTNGTGYLFAGGASSVVGGLRLNYFTSGSSSVGLWGYPDRHVQPWTIYQAPASAKHLTTKVAIRHAWM